MACFLLERDRSACFVHQLFNVDLSIGDVHFNKVKCAQTVLFVLFFVCFTFSSVVCLISRAHDIACINTISFHTYPNENITAFDNMILFQLLDDDVKMLQRR